MEMNEILESLPKHLFDFVIDQPYNSYTAQDHALWRYVMKQNVKYLSEVAHKSYIDGLKITGISIDRIPHMYGMNRILQKIGWAAVAVDGFIPPSAFMEFQAYNVLVIAADIRPIDQIEYTPAPDIIHEAAGHAPIISNVEYSEYLKKFGFLGSKALSSKEDYIQYEAIRHLSILKADPYTSKESILKAEKELKNIENKLSSPSEMSLLRNLHWWTVEYGLIGNIDNPKIYGAGLLSSIGESFNCLKPHVKKLHYDLNAINYNFDITKPQPQLFVTPDFAHLNKVLDEYSSTMALYHGGLSGIQKAINSENLATAVWSSGLEVSGTFTKVLSKNGEPTYVHASSPTQLSFKGKQLLGHSKDFHFHGFGSPIGKLTSSDKPLELMTEGDLEALDISINKSARLEFQSGISVSGIISNILRHDGKIVLITFSDCLVKAPDGEFLFMADWGLYDMAVGESIVSVYNGPSDAQSFGLHYDPPVEKTHKIYYDETARRIHSLYQKVREVRENNLPIDELEPTWRTFKDDFPHEWLLAWEILEILLNRDSNGKKKEIKEYLDNLKNHSDVLEKLIDDGYALLNIQDRKDTLN